MNPKRSKLLAAAFVTALALFSLLLNAPLPAPTSPPGQPPLAGQLPTRIPVTSIPREDPPEASPPRVATENASASKAAPEPPAMVSGATATSSAPRESAVEPEKPVTIDQQTRAPELANAVASVPNPESDGEPVTVDQQTRAPELANAVASVAPVAREVGKLAPTREDGRSFSTVDPSRRAPRTVERPPERPRSTPAARAPEPPPRDAERRVRTLDDEVSALEKLLASGKDSPRLQRRPPSGKNAEPNLVTELERLFPAPTAPKPVSPARVAPVSSSRAVSSTAAHAVDEWQVRRKHYRALSREEDHAKVSAVFRLEPQDPETFRAVMAQYRMDVLLEIPSQGTYSIVPHGGDYWDHAELRKDQDDLQARYGLSIRDLSLPWLGRLRETHVSTKLVSTEAVDVAVLVPKPETELLLGSIVSGCRALGYSLEEVSACYGTFVERVLSGKRLYDYEVTRLVLKDGRVVKARGA